MEPRSKILLDTSVFIDHLRKTKKENSLLTRAIAHFERLFISVIAVYEVDFGSEKHNRSSDIQPFLNDIIVIALDASLAQSVAAPHAKLISQNQEIGFRDAVIAATALRLDLPLLTLNRAHFSRVSTLRIFDANAFAQE